jgi:hypothetical protein
MLYTRRAPLNLWALVTPVPLIDPTITAITTVTTYAVGDVTVAAV